MPRLITADDTMETGVIPGLAGYNFSAVRVDRLGASEYTLVTIAVDISGSVGNFRDDLVQSVRNSVASCRKSPKAGNILLRVVTFNHNLVEVHGFKPLTEIDEAIYDTIHTGGGTALYDAASTSVGAMVEFGRRLAAQDYGVNGVIFIITDGDDQNSKFGASAVRQKVDEAVNGEVLESCLTILIGVNAKQYKQRLEDFQRGAGITAYEDVGDANPNNLAKMASFISRSVSSQANAQGTGVSAQVVAGGSASIII